MENSWSKHNQECIYTSWYKYRQKSTLKIDTYRKDLHLNFCDKSRLMFIDGSGMDQSNIWMKHEFLSYVWHSFTWYLNVCLCEFKRDCRRRRHPIRQLLLSLLYDYYDVGPKILCLLHNPLNLDHLFAWFRDALCTRIHVSVFLSLLFFLLLH